MVRGVSFSKRTVPLPALARGLPAELAAADDAAGVRFKADGAARAPAGGEVLATGAAGGVGIALSSCRICGGPREDGIRVRNVKEHEKKGHGR